MGRMTIRITLYTGILSLIILILTGGSAWGQISKGKSNGTFSGLVFSDYYWFAESHNQDLKGENGWWFRRIYLTYDQPISDSFSSRLRLEMSSPGDLSTDEKITPVVKDAFIKWANKNHEIRVGISPTPIFGLVEDVWGYRSVEKAPQDLYGLGSSRDFGISFKGRIGDSERVGYHLFVGNGNSNKSEINRGKKYMLAVSYQLTDHLVAQAYGDWDDKPGDSDWVTIQGFAGYQTDRFNLGTSYSYQLRSNGNNNLSDIQLDLVSLFANVTLTDNIAGFVRADHIIDPVPSGESISYLPMSADAESSTFFVGGLDMFLHENIHIMPNIEAIVYGENQNDERPNNDIIPRLTLFYTF